MIDVWAVNVIIISVFFACCFLVFLSIKISAKEVKDITMFQYILLLIYMGTFVGGFRKATLFIKAYLKIGA